MSNERNINLLFPQVSVNSILENFGSLIPVMLKDKHIGNIDKKVLLSVDLSNSGKMRKYSIPLFLTPKHLGLQPSVFRFLTFYIHPDKGIVDRSYMDEWEDKASSDFQKQWNSPSNRPKLADYENMYKRDKARRGGSGYSGGRTTNRSGDDLGYRDGRYYDDSPNLAQLNNISIYDDSDRGHHSNNHSSGSSHHHSHSCGTSSGGGHSHSSGHSHGGGSHDSGGCSSGGGGDSGGGGSFD